MNNIIEEVKQELKLGYVPKKPMELAIKKERERILKRLEKIFENYKSLNISEGVRIILAGAIGKELRSRN